METKANNGYCPQCKKDVTCHYRPIDHKKELFRTLFTLGLWLPMWVGMMLVKIRVCDTCGEILSE